MEIIKSIQNRIYEIREERVILDFDIARLYDIDTKRLKESVRRNLTKFPKDFMFRLTKSEYATIESQIETLEIQENPLRTQIATSKKEGLRYMPFGFTEQGV